MKKAVIFIMLFALVTLGAYSQKETVEFKLILRDGNIVSGTTQLSSAMLQTSWGNLVVPVKDISQIICGINPDKTSKDKIKALLLDLNNSTESIRKKAYSELTALNIGCIPVLEELLNDESNAASIFEDYTSAMALEELKLNHNYTSDSETEDVVVTSNGYRIGGNLNLKDISVKTKYGTLEVPRGNIKSIEVYYSNNDGSESVYTLHANKHITGNTAGGWLKTSIIVKAGQKISILSSGEISLASLSGNKYKPDGSYSGGNNYDYDGGDYAASTSTYPTYGNVVFKIGENGTMLKAGTNYKGNAALSGYLYISIYETVFNAANTGTYTVRVKVN